MEQLQITHKLTLAEYNQLEEDTQQRYEYHDGEVFAMAGAATDVGDPRHNVIGGNVIYILNQLLRKKNCKVYTVEVLSDSTEAYDRGRKFEYFSKLSSLREYVLLREQEPKAQSHYRSSASEPCTSTGTMPDRSTILGRLPTWRRWS